MMRRFTGWWFLVPLALVLFGFIFSVGSGAVSAQGSPAAGMGSGAMGGLPPGQPQMPQSNSTPGAATPAAGIAGSAAAGATATGAPYVAIPQPVATGPSGVIYPPFTPRRLRDG